MKKKHIPALNGNDQTKAHTKLQRKKHNKSSISFFLEKLKCKIEKRKRRTHSSTTFIRVYDQHTTEAAYHIHLAFNEAQIERV